MSDHARLFRSAGHEVTVLSGEGVADHLLPELRRAQGGDAEGDYEPAAAALRERLRPLLAPAEIVFLHNVCTMPFHPALTMALWDLAAALPQTRFLCWVHDLAVAQPEYPLPSTPARPWSLYRQASPHFEYIAVSEWRREQLQAYYALPAGRVRVIRNGLFPLDHWGVPPQLGPFLEQGRFLERGLLLLHPARLVRRKHLEESLRVLAALRHAGRDAALLITGASDPHLPASAAYRAELLALRSELGLEAHAVILADSFPDLDEVAVSALYRVADALLLPSRHEGFGLPPLEAALQRLPFFAPRLPALVAHFGDHPGLYPLDFTSSQIAALIISHLDASAAIPARQRVLSAFAWPALYRNLIAPLLAEPHKIPGPPSP